MFFGKPHFDSLDTVVQSRIAVRVLWFAVPQFGLYTRLPNPEAFE